MALPKLRVIILAKNLPSLPWARVFTWPVLCLSPKRVYTPFSPMAPEPEKKPNFFQRLFGGKKDTAKKDEPKIDTAGKTKKQIRQEKRELKKLEKQRQQELKERGVL
jgi:hypothetical protein